MRNYDTFDEESASRIGVEVDSGDLDMLGLIGGVVMVGGVSTFLYFTIGVAIPDIWRFIQDNQFS